MFLSRFYAKTRCFGPLRGPFVLLWLVTDGDVWLVTDGEFWLVTDGDFWLVTDGDFWNPQEWAPCWSI